MDNPPYISIENEPFVQQEHPELHHYTDWTGLNGIWHSGELYSTRYDCLNDRTEVEHFRAAFTNALENRLKAVLLERKRVSQKAAIELSKAGGAAEQARQQAKFVVDALYNTTFSTSNFEGAFAVPFITSFCSHAADHLYEQENGLLSQWRGYGCDEGYTIVFDTQKLVDLITEEKEKYCYATIGIMDVVYNDQNFDFEKRFSQLLDVAVSRHIYNLTGQDVPDKDAQNLFLYFISAASRFKHRGFREEREVRIVGFVHRRECLEKLYKDNGYPIPTCVYKETHIRNGKEQAHLFDWNEKKRLPIKRIIVGPHKDQKNLEKKVVELTKGTVPVVCSATPYIG